MGKLLTDSEYVAEGGAKCPHCRSNRLTGGERQFEGTEAFLDVTCDNCGNRWVEVFKMVGWMPR